MVGAAVVPMYLVKVRVDGFGFRSGKATCGGLIYLLSSGLYKFSNQVN